MISMTDLQNLDMENIGDWPKEVYIAAVIMITLGIVLLGYVLILGGRYRQLSSVIHEETSIRDELKRKKKLALTLPAYQHQLKTVETTYEAVINVLPVKGETPTEWGDVEGSISRIQMASGLEEIKYRNSDYMPHGFYEKTFRGEELSGNFREFMNFIESVSNFPRITTIKHIKIEQARVKARRSRPSESADAGNLAIGLRIEMYRRIEKQADDTVVRR